MENTKMLYHFASTAAGTVIPRTKVVMELCASGQHPETEILVALNDLLATSERNLTYDTNAMKRYRQRSISEHRTRRTWLYNEQTDRGERKEDPSVHR